MAKRRCQHDWYCVVTDWRKGRSEVGVQSENLRAFPDGNWGRLKGWRVTMLYLCSRCHAIKQELTKGHERRTRYVRPRVRE